MIFKSQCLEIQSTIRIRDIFISGVLQSIVPGISVGRVVPSFMMIMVRRTTHFVVQFFEWLSYSDFFYSRVSSPGCLGTCYVSEHNLEHLILLLPK